MTQEAALAVMIAVAVALLGVGVWAWLRRARRDGGIAAPVGEAPADAAVLATFDGFYVATTRHDDALERLAIRGLAFRSRARLVVTTAGLALDLTGQPRVFLSADRLVDVRQATVAIDRVVEKDGLVRVAWRTDDGEPVDTFLRAQDASAAAVARAIDGILPAPQTSTTPTGTDV